MTSIIECQPLKNDSSFVEKYMVDSEELMKLVDSFVSNHIKSIEDLFERQMRERFQLIIRHSKTTPYGPKGWVHYKTLSSRRIMSEIKSTEIINENLLAFYRKAKKRTQREAERYHATMYEPANIEMLFEPIGFVHESSEE